MEKKRVNLLQFIKSYISLQCVFHGIRFKVNKIGCRETINFFCIYPNFLPVFAAAETGD